MTDATTRPGTPEAQFGDYVALLKPRVMSLVVFTALVGLLVAPGGVHPVLAFSFDPVHRDRRGRVGALNMWWDADIDRASCGAPAAARCPRAGSRRARRCDRGSRCRAVVGDHAGAGGELAGRGLLAFTIFFYAVVYTMWLKRSTPQNIVIGGAAGAFPPLIGWAAATGGCQRSNRC
jgi:protoheme IX farnesyltransferase